MVLFGLSLLITYWIIYLLYINLSTHKLYSLLLYLLALTDKHDSLSLEWNHIHYNPLIIRVFKLIKRNYLHQQTKKAELISQLHLQQLSNTLSYNIYDDLLFLAIAFSSFYGLAHLAKTRNSAFPDIVHLLLRIGFWIDLMLFSMQHLTGHGFRASGTTELILEDYHLILCKWLADSLQMHLKSIFEDILWSWMLI